MTNRRVCILGAGNMGRALIGGLLRGGWRSEQLSAGESEAAARTTLLREFGVSATDDNRAAVAGAAIVVLAVKPQDAAAVLQPLAAGFALNRPLLISVAAGVRVAALESWCGAGVPVMRAMPNRPAWVGAGATGVYAPPAVGAQQRAAAERVLQALGEVFWVEAEELLDVVTALSGSGPAYFFLLAELMAEAATQLGLESGMAHRLAAATLYGSGLLARSGDGDLARLRQEVTSTGGTTEAALRTLEAADLRTTVRAALAAATQRGRELAAVRAG
ncbi:MAG TPA: pyrroline-5-carboxylate reductase [Steroidobacteraceae bacterium]|nr:pyrroline-5-carboxylate reductase [Steroidobacteraceae bacterium]